MRKALGRCSRKHVQVVEYADGTLPAGTCKVETCKGETCKEPLTEWAVKNPIAGAVSAPVQTGSVR